MEEIQNKMKSKPQNFCGWSGTVALILILCGAGIYLDYFKIAAISPMFAVEPFTNVGECTCEKSAPTHLN